VTGYETVKICDGTTDRTPVQIGMG